MAKIKETIQGCAGTLASIVQDNRKMDRTQPKCPACRGSGGRSEEHSYPHQKGRNGLRRSFQRPAEFLFAVIICMLLSSVSEAQVQFQRHKEELQVRNWQEDLRTALNRRGIYLNAMYTGDFFSNRSGGIHSGLPSRMTTS